jgi:hypothetical protein
LTNLRSQCVSHCIKLLTHEWVMDDREWVPVFIRRHSHLTQYLLRGKVPRGFMNEILNRAAMNQDLMEKVSKQCLS